MPATPATTTDAIIIDVAIVPRSVRATDARPPVTLPHCGAEALFLGRTRAESTDADGRLEALDYDVYPDMALARLEEIASAAAKQHHCAYIGVRHAQGRVPIGEASVLIRALAGHRDQAFAACRNVIDELKRSAPIWKKEVWTRAERWRADTPLSPPSNPDNNPRRPTP